MLKPMPRMPNGQLDNPAPRRPVRPPVVAIATAQAVMGRRLAQVFPDDPGPVFGADGRRIRRP